MCSGRIQTHIFRKTSVTAAGIFILSYIRLQASCPHTHTQTCHKIAIRPSAQQNTACVIMHVRDSSITIGVSNDDFILKKLQLDHPSNLQNHDIPNSYASKSDFTVQGTVTCDTQGYFRTSLNSRCIWIQHGGLNLPQHYLLNYN